MVNSKFPGGEMHVRLESSELVAYTHIANLWSSDDIMEMLLRNNAIKQHSLASRWVIPYVPYARQDRVCNYGEALSIQVMADLINSLDAYSVEIWDPHSDVTSALIKSVCVIEQHVLVKQMVGDRGYSAVVAPDAGAAKKAFKVAQALNIGLVHAHKVRDPATGEIQKTVLLDELPKSHLPLLVVDDICDGGRTFTELGKLLYGHKADLYVTHGIFSKGVDVLDDYYDRIFCANPRNPELADQYSYFYTLEDYM